MGKKLVIKGANFSEYGIPTERVAFLKVDGNSYYMRLSPTVTINGATITFTDTDYTKVDVSSVYDEKPARWNADTTSISLGKSTTETLNADSNLLYVKLYRDNDSITSLKGLFANCSNLIADFTAFNGAGITDLSAMFFYTKMNELPTGFKDVNFGGATTFDYMFFFSDISGELDLSSWRCTIGHCDSMFQNSKFTKINLSGWSFGSAWMNYLFTNCYNLTEINFDGCTFNAGRLQYASQLFYNANALVKLDVKDINSTIREHLLGNLAISGFLFYASGDTLLKDNTYGNWVLDSSSTTLDSSYSQYSGTPSDYSTSGTYKVYVLYNGKYYMFSKTVA